MKGGYRPKKRIRNGQALLLDVLIENHGGPQEFAARIGVNPQIPINWRAKGVVPPKMLGKVAKALGVSPWGLNYSFLKEVMESSDGAPPWKDVVTVCLNTETDIQKVLKGKHPDV